MGDELRHSDAANIEKYVGCNSSCITPSRLVKSAICGERGYVHQTLLSLGVSCGVAMVRRRYIVLHHGYETSGWIVHAAKSLVGCCSAPT